MAKFNKSFRKNPKYPHKRSEGLTRRGQARQERLMLGGRVVARLVFLETK